MIFLRAYSLLSGYPLIVYASQQYDINRLVDIAKFLSSLCLNGLSTDSHPQLEIIDKLDNFFPCQYSSIQVFVIPLQKAILYHQYPNCCLLDVCKSFYGLYYNDYYNSGFSYEPYPINNNQNCSYDSCCRSSS